MANKETLSLDMDYEDGEPCLTVVIWDNAGTGKILARLGKATPNDEGLTPLWQRGDYVFQVRLSRPQHLDLAGTSTGQSSATGNLHIAPSESDDPASRLQTILNNRHTKIKLHLPEYEGLELICISDPSGGAITTMGRYDDFADAICHLNSNGDIMRFRHKIGTIADIDSIEIANFD